MDFTTIGPIMCLFGFYIGGIVGALINLTLKEQDDKQMQRCIMHFRGYRSKMSKKNLETWNFAQRYSCICFIKVDTTVFFALVLVEIIRWLEGMTLNELSIYTLILVQLLLPRLIVRFFTERALKENFNENGSKKQL